MATTVKCKDGQVLVIDSVQKSLDDKTKSQNKKYSLLSIPTTPVIKVVNPQRQKGEKDRGLFAIAYGTAIAFDQNAAKKRLNQESMRTHLAACLQQNKNSHHFFNIAIIVLTFLFNHVTFII